MIELCITLEGYSSKPTHEEYIHQSNTLPTNTVKLHPEELADRIEDGYAWTASTFSKDSQGKVRRRLEYWNSQQIIAADLDDGKTTPEQALKIARSNGLEPMIIHHTFSSKPTFPKLRVIFCLEDSADDSDIAKRMWLKIGKMYSSDCSSGDIVKIYQGSKMDSITHFNPDAFLDVDDFGDLPIEPTALATVDLSSLVNVEGSQRNYNGTLKSWQKHIINTLERKVMLLINKPHKGTEIRGRKINSRYSALFTSAIILGQCELFYLNYAKQFIKRQMNTVSSKKVWGDWDRDDDQINYIIDSGLKWGRSRPITYTKPVKTK